MTQVDLAASDVPRRVTRPLDRAWGGGVCAAVADNLGVAPVLIRAIFVALGAWKLVGVAVYLVLWLALAPAQQSASAPGVDAATRTGMRTSAAAASRTMNVGEALALGLLSGGLLWLVQTLGWGLPQPWLFAGVLASAGLGITWWLADHVGIRAGEGDWRGWAVSVVGHWTTVVGLGAGLLLLGASAYLVLWALPAVGPLTQIVIVSVLSIVALALVAAPWLLRARRALAHAREQKMLSDARADMAAHLHDSVLQTLALIQRQSTDPRAVVRLARRQERQLRSWLYGEESGANTVREALVEAAQAVEDDFEVQVECVTVGDADLTPALAELANAAREAMVNAAKHSGASLVDVYAEVGETVVEVFVRDRGRGFDTEQVPDDRMGVRGSIKERMARHGGAARIRSEAGHGTEVSLEMRR